MLFAADGGDRCPTQRMDHDKGGYGINAPVCRYMRRLTKVNDLEIAEQFPSYYDDEGMEKSPNSKCLKIDFPLFNFLEII
jgi:hypothetical protein